MDANPNGSGLSDDAATQAITGLLDQGLIRTDDEDDAADDAEDQAAAPEEPEAEDDDGAEDEADTDDSEGDEESEDADEDDDNEAEPERFTVKINGKEQQVTRDELVAGYQMGEDYRQKTMALADQRRAFEAEVEKAQQIWTQRLQQAAQAVQSDPILSRTPEEWQRLKQEDPIQFATDLGDYQLRKEAAQQRQAELQQVQNQQREERLAREQEAIARALPEWNNEAKRSEIISSVVSAAKSAGFTDDEIANGIAFDHRALVLVHKAAQYDRVMSKKSAVEKKVVDKPKVQKPMGARNKVNPAAEAKENAMKRLRKSGSDKDANAAFLSVI